MNGVSAIIVTRGDVSLHPIVESFPEEWETLVWVNGTGLYRWREDIAGDDEIRPHWQPFAINRTDYSVYGRYLAIPYASNDLIYVQDDDVLVSDPDAIARAYYEDMLACNMPQEFRHDFYSDHALVGFGAAFHRDMPKRAFDLFWQTLREDRSAAGPGDLFYRTCDIVFTGLTPRVLVDVTKMNLPYAEDENRMWKQSTHQAERTRMLELVLRVREETS